MYEVDARGLSCPEPVMLTHEALKNHGGEPEGSGDGAPQQR